MARTFYNSPTPDGPGRSPSPGPSTRSPPPSDSSFDDEPMEQSLDYSIMAQTQLGSRPASPSASGSYVPETPGLSIFDDDTVTCEWESCGTVYNHLPSLIDHIHNDHIGVHKSNYTCEWASCARRGLAQTSRFALISHIRSHTGEKPFICPRPECDKSFTRSDALAKHMRLQHNISPPLPGRGGSKKRKRGEKDDGVDGIEHGTPSGSAGQGRGEKDGYSTFKLHESGTPYDMTPGDYEDRGSPPADDYFSALPPRHSPSPENDDDPYEGIPRHLLDGMDPETGLILGRSPVMVKYLIMKAKHRFVVREHESLLEELRVVRLMEEEIRDAKEAALDNVLNVEMGPDASHLLTSRAPQAAPQSPYPLPPPYHSQEMYR